MEKTAASTVARTAARTAMRTVRVLLPLPLADAYDYSVPEGMDLAAGQFVTVPLGKRETVGVVWGEGSGEVAVEKLRDKLDNCADTRRIVNSMLREMIDGIWFKPAEVETHVLVAGVHAFRFNGRGEMTQEAVATAALIDEAGRMGAALGNDARAALALERYLRRT